MKRLPSILTIALLSAGAGPVYCQTIAPAAAPAETDTVQAIRRLFHARRVGGGLFVSGAGATAATFTGLLSTDESFGAGTDVVLGTAIAGLYTAPFWSVGASKLIRFSKKREQQTIDRYLAHRTLEPKLRRRMKKRYFR